MKNNKFKQVTTSLICGFDQSAEDDAVLIVGHQEDGKMKIINAFKDEEAIKLYKMLTKPTMKMFEGENKE